MGVSLRYVATFFTLALYGLVGPWGYLVFALVAVFPLARDRRRRLLQGAMRGGYILLHTWMRWFRLMDVRIEVTRDQLPSGPCVIVANHPTLVDVTTILRLVPEGCTIAKPMYYQRWWLKPLLKGSGQIEGANLQPLSAARVVERAIERLREGAPLVVFPESTRTEHGRKMPFHRLAFEIASRADVPVVPLVIRCVPSYLSKENPLLRLPKPVPVLTVSMLPALDPGRFDNDSRQLCDRVRSQYRELGALG